MRHAVHIALAAVTVLALAGGGLMLFAPQVPTLWQEGFPPPVWTGEGTFALVDGPDTPLPKGAPLPAPAAQRFADSEGRALLVMRDGQLVHEVYGPGIGPETRLNSYSLVKSLVGALVLRAHAEGRIDSLDTPLAELIGPEAPAVTLREVLDMTSGLSLGYEPPKADKEAPLDDADFSPFGPVARLHGFGIETLLPRLSPGPDLRGSFHYQSANTALLGLVVEKVHGALLPQVLSTQIWQPSGAAPAEWRKNPNSGRVSAYCCLYATPRDWAKVAHYLLQNGTGAHPFLPDTLWRDWILPDLAPAVRHAGAYDGHLRHDVLDRPDEALQGPFAYMAGHGGQVVYLLPGRDAVVVRFGARPQLLHTTLYELFPE
ncbi:CubicO group peptidase, beta-lactamase class C family [Mameliella alba]|uniref:serine hydrolase domain-containing protein n=1 Tax=Mameliella alba TaxID=561184 RepID=UPI00088CDD3A|nr:serine hydrolase [Mameliella alba]PTR39658.1 CubicO group peptidase (beta-lactamase class C family) [Mameliella alba]GGF62636.1 serine hydrolase [Mameliella alba]SDD16520.1 CubicO group peptidase, beta-lactamase class C family [Mameliella alba]